MPDKYSKMDMTTCLGFLVNAMSGGGDRNQAFSQSDAEDMSRGVRFIPGEVTLARRHGEHVEFVQKCPSPCCWYWRFQDGTRVYHWDRWEYERIAGANEIELEVSEFGSKTGSAGPCPRCGNVHTCGGIVPATPASAPISGGDSGESEEE